MAAAGFAGGARRAFLVCEPAEAKIARAIHLRAFAAGADYGHFAGATKIAFCIFDFGRRVFDRCARAAAAWI